MYHMKDFILLKKIVKKFSDAFTSDRYRYCKAHQNQW